MDSGDCQGFAEFRRYSDSVVVRGVLDSVSVRVLRAAAVHGVNDVICLREEREEHEQQREAAEEIQQSIQNSIPHEHHSEWMTVQ